MQHSGWAPPDSDLLAYLMDDLEGARAEYLAVHLHHCAGCRARLDELRETLGLLQTLTMPGLDDDQHRAALKARIASAAESSAAPARSVGWRFAPAGVALVALLVLAIATGPALARAGDVSLNDILRVVPGLGNREHAPQVIPITHGGPPGELLGLPAGPTIDPATLSFAALAPAVLPDGNQLVASIATPDGAFHATYAGADGLNLLIAQRPAAGTTLESTETGELAQIDGIDVVIYDNEIGENVVLMLWVHGDVLFEITTVAATPAAFPLQEARALASALIRLQDGSPGATP